MRMTLTKNQMTIIRVTHLLIKGVQLIQLTNRHRRYKALWMMIMKMSREKRGQWRC